MINFYEQITKTKDFGAFRNSVVSFSHKDHNHPVAVVVNPVPNSDGTFSRIKISSEGVEITKSPGARGRGVEIEIWFWSEEGGYWRMEFEFRKGNTFLNSEWITNILTDEQKDKLHTIWRD